LRFLEDGSYRRLGDTRLLRSDVLVIAATNIDLDDAVAKARFRRDLLARLRARNEPLQLPPLRKRKEDIPGWTQLFFREAHRDAGSKPWTAGALECLLLYPWEDNLRGLRQMVASLAAMSPAFLCGIDQLPAKLRGYREARRMGVESPVTWPEPSPEVEFSDVSRTGAPAALRSELSRIDVENALRSSRGSIRQAAERLGISRRALYRLCEHFDVQPDDYRGEWDAAPADPKPADDEDNDAE